MGAIIIGDTSTSPNYFGGETTSITLAQAVAATSNLLVVMVIYQQDTARNSTVAFNGDAMTKLVDVSNDATSQNQVELFYLKNPDTGTHNIVVTSGSQSSNVVVTAIDAFIPSNSQLIDSDSASGTTDPALAVPCKGTESLIVAGVSHVSNTARTPDNGQTEICDLAMAEGSLQGRAVAGYKVVSGATSQAMNWSGTNGAWVEAGASFSYEYGGGFLINLV